ncbi:hypothetical protein WAK64_11660 [Bacillus spongiae]|uniref:Uncharacterized protein n=1 Tax=Bacillus spongiae TaxID=2683610 RepID=A0ABU8HEC0_9BACI
MTIEKVIEVYKGFEKIYEAPIVIISEILCIIILISFIIHLIKDRKSFSFLGSIIRGFFLVFILSIMSFLFVTIVEYDFSMSENQWEENYVTPYINSLPEQKYNVKDFSQLLNENKGIYSIYLDSLTKPTWVSVEVLDDDGKYKEITVQTIFKKESIDTPYLTYKKIEKDISNKYNANVFYETVLHIPKEYKILVPSN